MALDRPDWKKEPWPPLQTDWSRHILREERKDEIYNNLALAMR